jgi:ABC-type bacteriocin/lantibiotic exporter with double-glycine peptidase domain
LNQESAWFDQENYNELSSRLGKECDTIQRGIGSKCGSILYSYAMCLAGLFVGFYKGWTLAFAMLAIAPVLLIGMGIFSSVLMKRAGATMRAYGQSAGYAE